MFPKYLNLLKYFSACNLSHILCLIKSFGRGNMFATVTNTTVEIVVSEHVFGSVYGEDGGNLDRIRQVLNYFLNKDYNLR